MNFKIYKFFIFGFYVLHCTQNFASAFAGGLHLRSTSDLIRTCRAENLKPFVDLTEEEVEANHENLGMPKLPKYELVGTRGDRLWNESDIDAIRAFKDWRPLTRNGFLKNMKPKGE